MASFKAKDSCGHPVSARTVLTDKRGLAVSLPELLTAVGIGLALLTAAGLGIAAAYNYGQDAKAQGALDSVRSAQMLYQAQHETFGDLDDLKGTNPPTITGDTAGVKITANANGYCAYVKSNAVNGKELWLTDVSEELTETMPTGGAVACPTATTP